VSFDAGAAITEKVARGVHPTPELGVELGVLVKETANDHVENWHTVQHLGRVFILRHMAVFKAHEVGNVLKRRGLLILGGVSIGANVREAHLEATGLHHA
jgi:hypothetical protein